MASVFRKGDVVYHPTKGKGKISFVNPRHNEYYDGDYRIDFETDNDDEWCNDNELSFTPWPKPCHERPFTEVGWWIGKLSYNDNPTIRWRITEKDHKFNKNNKASYTTRDEEINWIKFLGTEL